MKSRTFIFKLLLVCLPNLPGAAYAVNQAQIPEPELMLIRAFGFIEGPRLIAKTCAKANPKSASGWNKEVIEFEQRRSADATRTRNLFSQTYAKAIGEKEAMAILDEKIRDRLEQEAAAKRMTLGTLCLAVSIFGGKKAFESKGFEETMQSLAAFEKTGEYKRLKTRISRAPRSEKALYKERLQAYRIK